MQKASDREVIRLGRAKSAAREEIVETVSSCIQCGTCTSSCPTAPAMDYTPRQIMHMVQQQMFDEGLYRNARRDDAGGTCGREC